MFEQTFLEGAAKTRRAWTVPAGFAGQLAVIAGLALMPTVFYEGIPVARLAPPAIRVPGAYHPPVDRSRVMELVRTGQEQPFRPRGLVAPSQTPVGVHQGPEPRYTAPPDNAVACIEPCVPGGIDATNALLRPGPVVPAAQFEATPAPVRQTPRATPTPVPIRVTSGPQEAKLIDRVTPVYPPRAISMRISGPVRLTAIITTDGRIRELQVISGHPWLVPAAVDAVRQWTYRPTMLNGAPVEVITDITVTFSLNQR